MKLDLFLAKQAIPTRETLEQKKMNNISPSCFNFNMEKEKFGKRVV
jgi:hypothetical protein